MEMVVNSKIAGKKNGSTYVVEKEICSDEKSMSNSSHQNFIEDISKPEVNVNLSQSLLICGCQTTSRTSLKLLVI